MSYITYCFYYCSKFRKFVNLNVLTNLSIAVGIVNQTATQTLFAIKRHLLVLV